MSAANIQPISEVFQFCPRCGKPGAKDGTNPFRCADCEFTFYFSPIAAGITNTNYALQTECGNYVLTLYEHHSDEELDYILGLQQHLADRAVLCPAPVRDRRGDFHSVLNQRPAAINRCLPPCAGLRCNNNIVRLRSNIMPCISIIPLLEILSN